MGSFPLPCWCTGCPVASCCKPMWCLVKVTNEEVEVWTSRILEISLGHSLQGGGSVKPSQTAFSKPWGKIDDFFLQWTSLGTMSGFLTACKRSQLQNILLQKQTCSSTKCSLFVVFFTACPFFWFSPFSELSGAYGAFSVSSWQIETHQGI